MSKRKNLLRLRIPNFSVQPQDSKENDFLVRMINSGTYPKFFMFFIRQVIANPNVLKIIKDNKNTKEDNANNVTLTEISDMIKGMNSDHSELLKEIQISNETSNKALEQIQTLMDVNNKLHSSLTEIMDKLSQSTEGMVILQDVSKSANLDKIIEESKQVNETTQRVFGNISSNPMISSTANAFSGKTNEELDKDDDEDDLFGGNEEDALEAIRQFRGM